MGTEVESLRAEGDCAASIAGVLGLTLATSSEANFQAGVTKRHAPDVVLELNAAKVTPAGSGASLT